MFGQFDSLNSVGWFNVGLNSFGPFLGRVSQFLTVLDVERQLSLILDSFSVI